MTELLLTKRMLPCFWTMFSHSSDLIVCLPQKRTDFFIILFCSVFLSVFMPCFHCISNATHFYFAFSLLLSLMMMMLMLWISLSSWSANILCYFCFSFKFMQCNDTKWNKSNKQNCTQINIWIWDVRNEEDREKNLTKRVLFIINNTRHTHTYIYI